MRLFESIGADAAYDRYLEPPQVHEIDECQECHDAGDHESPLAYYEVCEDCAKALAEKVEHATFEFKFTVDDVEKARDWARERKYRYETVEHLLLDAMRSNVIHTDHWQAAS